MCGQVQEVAEVDDLVDAGVAGDRGQDLQGNVDGAVVVEGIEVAVDVTEPELGVGEDDRGAPAPQHGGGLLGRLDGLYDGGVCGLNRLEQIDV